MHITNTRPLLDNMGPSPQGMRRNPSGILAGESMFKAGTDNKWSLPHERAIQDRHLNNRLRENWL